MKKLLSSHILLFVFLSAFCALFFAYISEFYFGLKPCILCLYQRIPFFIIIFSAILGFLFFKSGEGFRKKIAYFCALMFLINSMIAIYHVGVEKKIFQMTEKCSEQDLEKIESIEELKKILAQKSLAKCDEPQFIFLGVSMAGWNFVFCLLMAFFVFSLARCRDED